jgi:hypothetical protein
VLPRAVRDNNFSKVSCLRRAVEPQSFGKFSSKARKTFSAACFALFFLGFARGRTKILEKGVFTAFTPARVLKSKESRLRCHFFADARQRNRKLPDALMRGCPATRIPDGRRLLFNQLARD